MESLPASVTFYVLYICRLLAAVELPDSAFLNPPPCQQDSQLEQQQDLLSLPTADTNQQHVSQQDQHSNDSSICLLQTAQMLLNALSVIGLPPCQPDEMKADKRFAIDSGMPATRIARLAMLQALQHVADSLRAVFQASGNDSKSPALAADMDQQYMELQHMLADQLLREVQKCVAAQSSAASAFCEVLHALLSEGNAPYAAAVAAKLCQKGCPLQHASCNTLHQTFKLHVIILLFKWSTPDMQAAA